MAKCLKCNEVIKKRMVLCSKDWKDLADVRKEAVRKIYSRNDDGMKFIDMLINGDLKTVNKIVADKEASLNAIRGAKAFVDISQTPPEDVKVVYKVKV